MNNQATTEPRSDQRASITTARLVFPQGVANLTVRVDASMPGIYRGEFYGPKPQVTEPTASSSSTIPGSIR